MTKAIIKQYTNVEKKWYNIKLRMTIVVKVTSSTSAICAQVGSFSRDRSVTKLNLGTDKNTNPVPNPIPNPNIKNYSQ